MTKVPTKGFLFVASTERLFYNLAINAMDSLRDSYPEANICLVTEKRFLDGRESIADHIIHCGESNREKLWALSRTPFDITMYIDADSQIIHEDIATCFDMLQDNDILFVELPSDHRTKHFAVREWSSGVMTHCGGIVLYDIRKTIVKEFMEDWNKYYHLQRAFQWWPDLTSDGSPDFDLHPKILGQFDQFTLWWLIEKCDKYKDIKHGFFDDGDRWNWYMSYEVAGHAHPERPVIIEHFSGIVDK